MYYNAYRKKNAYSNSMHAYIIFWFVRTPKTIYKITKLKMSKRYGNALIMIRLFDKDNHMRYLLTYPPI